MTAPPRVGSRPVHWADVGEAGAVAGIWFMYWLNRLLGRWPFRVVLFPVVLYFYLRRGLARRASRDYLTRLEAHTGALGRPVTALTTVRHLFRFAETILDKALAVGGHYPVERLSFEGREVMLESLAAGRGGVLLTAHMGCLEVCQAAAERRDRLRLTVLVHTRHARRFNSVLRRLDPGTRLDLLQVTDFSPAMAADLAARVDRGEFVVIAADRVPVGDERNVVEVPFLGAPARFPVGPWVLAAALRCQIILLSSLRHRGSYHVRFERLHESLDLPRRDRARALAGLVAGYARRLEALCQRSPLDWFNFFPFWSR